MSLGCDGYDHLPQEAARPLKIHDLPKSRREYEASHELGDISADRRRQITR